MLQLDLWRYETEARHHGHSIIAGVDEAGRGPLAGPVVAAACVLPKGVDLDGIADSKKLTPARREFFYEVLVNHPAVDLGVGIVPPAKIDEVNILEATKLAMTQAVSKLKTSPDHLLVDGLHLPHSISCTEIIKGDNLSISIMAAAIAAKVTRDRIMVELDVQYPHYGFARHKGYGTQFHREALAAHGPCPEHRRSFSPVRDVSQ